MKEKNIPNLFILGLGTVGSEFLNIINRYKQDSFNIKAIVKSKEMIINPSIGMVNKKYNLFKKSIPTDIDYILTLGLFKSSINVIVDCTSSEKLAKEYAKFFDKGFSVVTASKIANTLSQNYFDLLRHISQKNKVHFYYGTNVGAGLPIISTLKAMISSGDKILRIDGIISGTLSYLFSRFDGSTGFSRLLKRAREKGFTEPDPRDDLTGLDVAKKMLILIRETGVKIELSDIKVQNLIPKGINPKLSINDFLIELSKYDSFFLDKYLESKKENQALRYIGSWDGFKAHVRLRSVNTEDPFYNQRGRENFIILKSERYNKIPLIIRGHGAGAAVTAAGILQDIELIK